MEPRIHANIKLTIIANPRRGFHGNARNTSQTHVLATVSELSPSEAIT